MTIEFSDYVQFCIQYASLALLYYDYILTFPLEVKFIWKKPLQLSTVLYVCCRYALISNVVYLLNISAKLQISCDYGYRISGALSVIGRSAIIVVWTARTYAIFNKNKAILGVFGLLGLSCIAVAISHVPTLSCTRNSNKPTRGLLSILMCVFEIASAILTTIRGLQMLRIAGMRRTSKNGFVFLVLEQGLIYFCLVSTLTVASLVLSITIPGGFFQRLLNAITLPLSGLLTARFLLHLREWDSKHSRHRDLTNRRHSPSEGADVEFSTVIISDAERTTRFSSFIREFGQ